MHFTVWTLKGDLLCKIPFYKVLCVCKQPDPPNQFYLIPINHYQSLRSSRFRFPPTLCLQKSNLWRMGQYQSCVLERHIENKYGTLYLVKSTSTYTAVYRLPWRASRWINVTPQQLHVSTNQSETSMYSLTSPWVSPCVCDSGSNM